MIQTHITPGQVQDALDAIPDETTLFADWSNDYEKTLSVTNDGWFIVREYGVVVCRTASVYRAIEVYNAIV